MNNLTASPITLLEKLSRTFGPSGCEDAVAKLILETIDGYYDELIPDSMGGVIALVRGTGKPCNEAIAPRRLMLSCHMDEVGFMIRSITEEGLLKIASMCGRDTRVLTGRRVLVGNENAQIPGVFGVKPIHLLKNEERDSASDMDSLYVDIGARSADEARQLVQPGDYGTFDSDFVQFGQQEERIKGKALDDRLGCTVLCLIMQQMAEEHFRPACDVYFAFTCREELGISGARCAAHKIDPDYAIVLEATAAADLSGTPAYKQVAKLGCGGAISLMDRSTIYDRDFTRWILDTAAANEIPCQIKQYVSGGNDAGSIHKTRAGIRCAAISAPARYIHTASNVIDKADYTAIRQLVMAILRRLGQA